jgi:rod shape-determining protein MreD
MALGSSHSSAPWLHAFGAIGFSFIAAASVFFAILISLIHLPGVPSGAIHWPALVILYWACYRPRWQPIWMVLILGVLCDLLSGSPLIGITAFIGIILVTLLRYQNHLILSLPFWILWGVLAMLIFIWRLLEFLAYGAWLGIWLPASVWLLSVVLSAFAFPVIALLLAPLRRAEFRF